MNAIISPEQPLSWWITMVVIWTVAIVYIVLALTVFAPPLWRAGLAWMRRLLPSRWTRCRHCGHPIDLNERRRQMNAAVNSRS